MAGDLNMNLLNFEQNKKVKNFLNIMFDHSMMPVINIPAHVFTNTATAIDHILINSVTTTNFKTGIIKSDISDHISDLCGRLQYSYKRNKETLLKFLAHFMMSISQKRKLN